MRKTPETWRDVLVGDVLMHEPTDRVFKVETMVVEHGHYTRITVYVINMMTRVTTMWVVKADDAPRELVWIGAGE